MKKLAIINAFFLLILAQSCQNNTSSSSIEDIEKRELSKGIRNDKLFLDLKLGMTSKEFYAVCWELNKQGILKEGRGNTSAMQVLDKGELKYPAAMLFYPRFLNDKIVEMPMLFTYSSWAPWNRDMQSDNLMTDVKKLLNSWYPRGTEFISQKDEKGNILLVKVNGNMKITISIENESEVRVSIIDLAPK